MKRTIFLKFLLTYVIVAFLAFFVASTLGRQLVWNHLVNESAERYYREANSIAAEQTASFYSKTGSLSSLTSDLRIIASAQNVDIRLIKPDGTVLAQTLTRGSETIPGFDYSKFGPKYYEISDFFGHYPDQHLNVLVPAISGFTTRGYVAVSASLASLSEQCTSVMRPLYLVTGVNLILASVLLLVFLYLVNRPLREITEGARQFASGNMTHKIDLNTKDEMGYLADTMNFMAVQLKKSSDYQRKFISNVSHDFRSPLTSIKGFTEAMVDGTIPPELHEKYLKTISSEADRLVKLTREILSLNSMDTDKVVLNLSDFDINEILKQTAAVFEGSCRKKKIGIRLILEGEALNVHADKEKIEQVLYNLLDNAVKFSDRNGEITVETSMRYGKCYVSVKDEGCGISKNDLPHVWDRFYKSDSSRGKDRQGTGLGLSIVKEIISAHDQNISVVSTEGVGTEFTFSLLPAGR